MMSLQRRPQFFVMTMVGAQLLGWFNPLTAEDRVDFNRDIRPLLSDHCFACHGPDAQQRQADLRLDLEDGAKAVIDGRRIIAPGKPQLSELIKRIGSSDPEVRMPPPDFEKRLTPTQIETFRRWVEQGAKWSGHWAFDAPTRPKLPAVKNAKWIRNAIDAFVLARLELEGLRPSNEATKETLIRRVTLDLTGLPPTLAEVDAYLNDSSPDAYERMVDRVLNSPRYGEHMAVRWLDAARYADTSGYQSDGPREMWRWRDWVIDAYNSGKPFDEFTIEQLGGDLLPTPTLDQRIATGFNRNHRGNAEGGIVPEEYAVEYVVDRVDTTFTVWQGLTIGCARCHDHKYDPLTQRDFYSAFAYFNNVPENGRALKEGNSPPFIKAPTQDQQRELARLESRLKSARAFWLCKKRETEAAQSVWESVFKPNEKQPIDWTVTRGLVGRFRLDGQLLNDATGKPNKSVQHTAFGFGRDNHAAVFDGSNHIDCGDVGNFGYFDKFTLSAWIHPTQLTGTIVSRMTLEEQGDGYNLQLQDGKVQLNLVKRWLDDSLRVETDQAISLNQWHHVAATYDASRTAKSIRIYVDGVQVSHTANLDGINQSMDTKEPLRIGAGNNSFHGQIDDVRVYDRDLDPDEIELIAATDRIADLVALPESLRTRLQSHKLRAYFVQVVASKSIREKYLRLADSRRALRAFVESIPTVMVMQDMPQPRDTHILIRGEYNKPGERVSPATPQSLPPVKDAWPRNRLGFARWLVDEANPLTARVAVNRYWQMLFGVGLVKSVEDFGAQGSPPSHPRLLDWLATEFVRSGWDVKQIMRLIVTSSTYRQASHMTPERIERDPENRLLARAPRFRYPAETIRDQALAISGLVSERLGGPSVRPYQPDGLWKEIASTQDYNQSTGSDLYRRSMYTFWKRTVAPPVMLAFDASTREACTVRQPRTNTPLQALALMNDVTFVEAARALAQNVLQSRHSTPSDRLKTAFRTVLARRPRPQELFILRSALEHHLARYKSDTAAALKLVEYGDHAIGKGIDVSELAGYTATLDLILNLDEFVTRE
ncbi:MAG: DUF1553 domain-containing protein [Planctomycetota bacterium]|nr:DUF1553 domain-containing protein [Planctomycetota bacterium]